MVNVISVIDTFKHFNDQFGFVKAFRIFLFQLLMRVGRSRFISKKNIINVNGYNISLISNDIGISTELRLFKTHEPLTTGLLSQEIKKDMICLDIGANIGYYALLENKLVGKNGKVIAIEPSPLNFNCLKNSLELQDYSIIEPYNFACGNVDGNVNFLTNERSNLSTVLENDQIDSNELIKKTGGRPVDIIKVPLKKLDSFLIEKPLHRIDFLRMDVEGFEGHIYEGMKNIIKKFKPKLHIEVHTGILGSEKTKKFLEKLKDDRYDIKYYIPRALDIPLVGNKNDIQNVGITDLLKKLERNCLPDSFEIFLE